VAERDQRLRPADREQGSGISLIQDLKHDNIHAIAIKPEGDKVIRMSAQTARIEARSVFLPRSAPWLDEFRQELLAFPASRHTDQIDAFSQALDHAFNARRAYLEMHMFKM
jgi:predicted phage terminase large subunit-like protein